MLQIGMFVGVIDIAGEGGAVVIRAARGIGDEVLAPGIEDLAPGVGEAVGDEDVEFAGSRFIAKYAGVGAAFGTVRGFNLRMVEGAFVEIHGSARIEDE